MDEEELFNASVFDEYECDGQISIEEYMMEETLRQILSSLEERLSPKELILFASCITEVAGKNSTVALSKNEDAVLANGLAEHSLISYTDLLNGKQKKEKMITNVRKTEVGLEISFCQDITEMLKNDLVKEAAYLWAEGINV